MEKKKTNSIGKAKKVRNFFKRLDAFTNEFRGSGEEQKIIKKIIPLPGYQNAVINI